MSKRKREFIRVALADDHMVLREGLVSLIQRSSGMEIAFEAADGRELLRKLATTEADVILLDLRMPEMDGLRAITMLRKNFSKVKIVVLSTYNERSIIIEAIKRGANGYLVKTSSFAQVEEAIEAVMEHGVYMNDSMSKVLYKGWGGKKRSRPDLGMDRNLSRQELRVLKLICEQLTTPEIAKKMDLSPKTIDNYRLKLMEKTGARNVAGLVIYAMERDMVSLDMARWKD